MVRIIAGDAKSLRFPAAVSGVRPTSERIRESIFSALDNKISWGKISVLDLMAGSGALGLEAISRGARTCVFVEPDKLAFKACAKNLRSVKAAITTREIDLILHNQTAELFLSATRRSFDLIFLDPPYNWGVVRLERLLQRLESRLAPGAIVVLEAPISSSISGLDSRLCQIWHREFGQSQVSFLEPPSVATVKEPLIDS